MLLSKLSVSTGQHSTAGQKAANQDFHGALVPEDVLLATKGIAFAIADGISTSALGAAAAETAVKSFLTDYYATSEAWSVRTSAERVLTATNSWMHGQNLRGAGGRLDDDSRERGMVCTFSGVVIKSRTAYVFHVGDGQVARIAPNLAGRSRFEPLTEPHRVWLGGGESYLARAMGIDRHLEIDHRTIALAAGDILCLTTDGVRDALDDAAILGILDGADDLHVAARAITGAALAAGAPDNLTVLLVRIDTLPDGELEDLSGSDADALPPAPRLEPGRDFEGYAILRELHSGSRSHVYLARDRETGARVVIKVPSTEHGADPAELQRLQLEEWVARRVRNTHVLKAPPAHGTRRHAYAVTEYLEGRTLEQWIADQPCADLASVRSLVRQIASGLLALHRREILHRDLRPANVIVDADGTARIIDFGSAQVAGLEELSPRAIDPAFAGTMQFTAPEIWLGAPASSASDMWSLGAVAYYMLTGALPYGPRLSNATTHAAQKSLRYRPASSINPDVPEWMDAAIACAVAINPARRYGELSEFVHDLSYPNPALIAKDMRPLMERRPERFWQIVSLVLATALIAAIAWQRTDGQPSQITSPRTEMEKPR